MVGSDAVPQWSASRTRRSVMPWVLLLCAVVLEIIWVVSLRESHGFRRLVPSIINICALLANLYLLSRVFHLIPLGTAYAVWTGLAAVGVVVYGLFRYGERLDLARISGIALVIIGAVILRLVTKE